MKSTKNTSLVIGAIVVAVTLLIFILGIPNGKSGIDYISLLFILIAEISGLSIPHLIKNNGTQNIILMPIIYVYAVVSILFSLVFKSAFENNISIFIIIHIVLMAIAAICYLASNKLVVDTLKNETETIQKKALIDECERVANVLYQDSRFSSFQKQLEKIYEEIKYDDHVSDYKSSEILSVLNEIYDSENDENIEHLCKKAIQLINERNITVKQLKRGGF